MNSDRVMDLTHPLSEEMPVWPGDLPFQKTIVVDYDRGYRLHNFSMAESMGTHVDAPAHFFQGKRTIEAIPANELIVPAMAIDVRDKVKNDPDYLLSADDILAWEAQYGKISEGTLVILNTGWHKRFNDPEKYLNFDKNKMMHFPGFGKDSAELLRDRNVVGIGIDTPSIDRGLSANFETHEVMLSANKYQIENLANLDELPPTGTTVIVGVLPVRDGSQAQARVLAILP